MVLIDMDMPKVCYFCRLNCTFFCGATLAVKDSERDKGMVHRQFEDKDNVFTSIPEWCPLKGAENESTDRFLADM